MSTATDKIDEALRLWSEMWFTAAGKIVELTLLGLATTAHEHGVTVVELSWSDQGNWLTIEGVQGPEGRENDDAYDAVFDSYDASDLRAEWESYWAAYLEADGSGDHYTLDVAEILEEFNVDLLPVPG